MTIVSLLFALLPFHSSFAQENTVLDNQTPVVKPAGNAVRRLKKTYALLDIEQSGKRLGFIKIELFIDKATKTVTNFIGLVEGTKEFKEYDKTKGNVGELTKRPFYDGLTFHRVSPAFLIQGGCPIGTGKGRIEDFAPIPSEIRSDLRHNAPGFVSMAHGGNKDSATTQFFITLSSRPMLDGNYTIFGKVVEGMDVVQAIAKVKRSPMDERPVEPVIMKKVTIIREYAK